MDMIVASSVMGASAGALAGMIGSRERQSTREGYRLATAFLLAVLTVPQASSIDGALILLLIPIGAAAITFELAWPIGHRLTDRRIVYAVVIVLALAFLIAWTVGFPPLDD